MGRFAVISMTEKAANRVREIVAGRDDVNGVRAHGIRLGIKKGGCAGMEYTVDLVTEPSLKDDHIERDGAHVYVAPEAALFLLGTEMDFEVTTLRTGFTFRNPNQSSACGGAAQALRDWVPPLIRPFGPPSLRERGEGRFRAYSTHMPVLLCQSAIDSSG